MLFIAVLVLGVAAGTVGGMVGFGSSVILMPALVLMFGAKQAVPIIAIASILANLSRAVVWWRDIRWDVNAIYCVTAVPAAALGARTMLALDSRLVEAILGGFLLVAIPARRALARSGFTMPLAGFALVGAGIGFLAGLVATTGPINTPFFLAYGLTKGGFLATEAIGAAAISITKITTFRLLDALPRDTVLAGLAVGSSLMLGSWLAKRLIEHMDASHYRTLLEAMMGLAGLLMLWSAWRG